MYINLNNKKSFFFFFFKLNCLWKSSKVIWVLFVEPDIFFVNISLTLYIEFFFCWKNWSNESYHKILKEKPKKIVKTYYKSYFYLIFTNKIFTAQQTGPGPLTWWWFFSHQTHYFIMGCVIYGPDLVQLKCSTLHY